MEGRQAITSELSTRDTRTPGLVRLGLWAGLTVAVGELAVLGLMEFVLDRYLYYVSPQIVWMIPLADVLIFGGIGAVLAGLRRVAPAVMTVPRAVGVLAFVGFTAIGYFFDEHVHDIALLLLAAGAATQAARLAGAKPHLLRPIMRGSAIAFTIAVLAATGVAESRGPLRERAEMAALPPAAPDAPNVLFIIWDTVRSHDLSAYGYERSTTPALSELAGSGALFEHGVSTASWTLPSHAGMFTGHYPADLSTNYTTPLDAARPTLAEALRERGYVTGGFVANYGAAGWESGLGRGFVRYEDFPRSWGQVFINARIVRTLLKVTAFRNLIGYHDVLGRKHAPAVGSGFLDWQTEHADRPFFAFLNYYDAHAPYLPPAGYATRFGPERPHGDPLLIERMNEPSDWDPAALQAELDAYDGAIAYLDDQLEALLDELERRGVLDNTLVILTSDHGEEFGEHDMLGHGDFLFAPLIHVPLILSMPGRIPAGLAIEEPVSLRNLPRTVLDLLEAETDETFPGYSLARWWEAAPPPLEATTEDETPVGPVVPAEDPSSWLAHQVEPVLSQEEGLLSIIVGRLHYLVDDQGNEQLFDVFADPLEARDLAGSPERAGDLEWFRDLASSRLANRPISASGR